MGKDLTYPKMSRTNRKRRNGGEKEGNSNSQTVGSAVRGRESETVYGFGKKSKSNNNDTKMVEH